MTRSRQAAAPPSVVGPLGRAATLVEGRYALDANSLVLLRRIAVLDGAGKLDEAAGLELLRWAVDSALGQDQSLLREVRARRSRALAELRDRDETVIRLLARPEWRLVVGLGNRANPYEIGLSMHGTYGWPVIPGSSLKGLAARWAGRVAGVDAPEVRRVFGSGADGRGSVRFLDALPAGPPATVTLDVLTPHQQPYYRSRDGDGATPPAEHHNPIPVHFLTVTGAFSVELAGRGSADANRAAEWLIAAGDELGLGAKTTAGYGYLQLSRSSIPERPA